MNALEQKIPIGFKQTEVGIIPEEWQVLTIDEAIASKMILDQMDGNHGELYPKSHEFKDDGIPYVGATDFYSGEIDYKHCKRLPLKRAKLFKKGVARDGDVLFAHNATVGPSSLVETHEDFIIISTTATYYRCNSEEIKNTYLLNFFRSKLFEKQYSSVMSQSTRNQVPILAQRKFYLAIPHIKEQTAIANALSDVDVLLTDLENLIDKKQAIKTASMQQLLTGKTRLPQFATHTEGEKKGQPKGTKPSELGEIPEDWEVVKMGDISKVNQGLQIAIEKRKLYPSTTSKPYITIQSLNSNEPVEYINEYSPAVCCTKNEILMTRTGNTGIVVTGVTGVFHNNFFKIIYNQTKLYKDFFLFFLRSPDSKKRILDKAGTSTIPDLNHGDFYSLPVILTSIEEQAAIATILSDMDNEIQTLEQRLKKTRQIKQGMMQELLTGRTRLPF